MIRVNPHFSHIEPNCTYNDGIQPWDIEDKLSAENLRKLEARVEELEELTNLENSKNKDRTRTPRFPLGFQPPFEAFSYNESENAGPTYSTSYDLPLVTDEWPTSLPPKQLVLHLVDLFFNCWSNSRRVLHRPTFLLALLESPSSPRFPYVGLLHAICAAGAIYSPFVTVAPLPPITNRPVDEIFMMKTQLLNDRVLAFDEENFLLAKYQCMDSANMGEHLLEVVQGKYRL
ncbi:hypothetical protein FRC12_015277 [Ceratobasidium sp. 428]|nr:hypothetical protein FRC12_015277 [Ceratobasidium sp. 428]